jgi:hypothetical protein
MVEGFKANEPLNDRTKVGCCPREGNSDNRYFDCYYLILQFSILLYLLFFVSME